MQKNNVQNIEISQGAVGARLKGLLQSPLPVDYKIKSNHDNNNNQHKQLPYLLQQQ